MSSECRSPTGSLEVCRWLEMPCTTTSIHDQDNVFDDHENASETSKVEAKLARCLLQTGGQTDQVSCEHNTCWSQAKAERNSTASRGLYREFPAVHTKHFARGTPLAAHHRETKVSAKNGQNFLNRYHSDTGNSIVLVILRHSQFGGHESPQTHPFC